MLNWQIKWNNGILLNTDHDGFGFEHYFTILLFPDSQGGANVWHHPCNNNSNTQ